MILALHVNFFLLGSPSAAEFQTNGTGALTRTFLEFVCIVAVNVFVLISGWFGIRVKRKGFLKFVYQILFFYFGIYFAAVLLGKPFSWDGITECLLFKNTGWFIKSYLCLYILAPVLNGFLENSDKKRIKSVIIPFFILQTLYAWIYKDAAKFFVGGYSAVSFIGLYLLAGYIRLYGKEHPLFNVKKHWDLICFFSVCILETIAFALLRTDNKEFASNLWIYSSPFVILSALNLLMFFSKCKLQSRFINTVASSSFSAYLFHSSFCILPFYSQCARKIYYGYSGLGCLGLMFGFIILVYTIAILIDRIRIFTWKLIEKRI